jgi:hypothetical protein
MKELVEIERNLWLAGEETFAARLAADAIVVMPMADGMLDRAETVRLIANAPRWQRVEFGTVYETRVAEGVVMLTYEAEAERTGAAAYCAFCTSLYRHDEPGWRLVHHQQTPLA